MRKSLIFRVERKMCFFSWLTERSKLDLLYFEGYVWMGVDWLEIRGEKLTVKSVNIVQGLEQLVLILECAERVDMMD